MPASPNISSCWPICYWHIRYWMPDFWPDQIAQTSGGEIYVPTESRTFTVEAESREIYVPFESRTFEVMR